ncbi:ABC transporter G family member 20-like [Oppia nitens]|uniref:ABC transporter G family member 20-like n=1 Tax=Oppia nitens TaxID=1686743 RepID=UPI0023DA02C6|nr:ABC transporter G family member 20-like [Oppia nitens]
MSINNMAFISTSPGATEQNDLNNINFINNDLNNMSNDNYNNNNKPKLAVNVRNVVFGYNKTNTVLKSINLKVREGNIFALLGANGCGKTTLLKLMLGRLRPTSGRVLVFGAKPNSKYCNIPGPGVGYMPQEIALFPEFTIREILTYFALLYHMDSGEAKAEIEKLIALLNLPVRERLIGQLSGGQQRLASIAVTMIHKPKVIILDEPTVGVDSLLRCRIWKYLENICYKQGNTVIITTHYIEEAKCAAEVGFMSSGQLLRQDNPQKLMREYQCSTLEEVYLRLCQKNIQHQKDMRQLEVMATDGQSSDISDIEMRTLTNPITDEDISELDEISHRISGSYRKKFIDMKHIQAMVWKSFMRTKRNPFLMIFFHILPLIVLTILSVSIGIPPINIPVAVYNGEPVAKLSQRYLDTIDSKHIQLVYYPSNESAYESVVRGINRMSIVFSSNFTDSFETRLLYPTELDDNELETTKIKVYADFSDTVVGNYIWNYMLETFHKFLKSFSQTLGYNPLAFALPMQLVEPPIYGQNDHSFNSYVLPGMMLAFHHGLPMILAAFLIIYERKNAHMDRAFVAGIKPIEVLIAHIIHNSVAVFTQVLLSLIISFVVFNNTIVGNYVDAYIMFVAQGLQGMTIGLTIALILADEVSAMVSLTGLMLPIWIMSGVFWPLEAIPAYFRVLANWTPLAQPIESLRSIMLRGWPLSNPYVLLGLIVSVSYTLILNLVNILVFYKFSAITLESLFHKK